jgi:hypothetical protein
MLFNEASATVETDASFPMKVGEGLVDTTVETVLTSPRLAYVMLSSAESATAERHASSVTETLLDLVEVEVEGPHLVPALASLSKEVNVIAEIPASSAMVMLVLQAAVTSPLSDRLIVDLACASPSRRASVTADLLADLAMVTFPLLASVQRKDLALLSSAVSALVATNADLATSPLRPTKSVFNCMGYSLLVHNCLYILLQSYCVNVEEAVRCLGEEVCMARVRMECSANAIFC